MPRNIHDSQAQGVLLAGQFQVGKSKIDGDSAKFFFRQTIRINASQCFDERTFSMIHVSGGRNDIMENTHGWDASRMAWIRVSSCSGSTVRKSISNLLPEIYPRTGVIAARSFVS